MSNGVKLGIVIGSVVLLAALYFAFGRKKESATAKSIKETLPADSPEKFERYLEETLTPEELRSFRGWSLMIEGYQLSKPDEYKKWMDGAKKGAKTYGIPEEVALQRGLLWQMTQYENPTLSDEKWKQIHVDSIYLYR